MILLPTAPDGFRSAVLALAQAAADTVVVVERAPAWVLWLQALSAIASIVVAVGLLIVGVGIIVAAKKVKQLTRTLEEQANRLRVDLAPAIANVNRVAENAGALSESVRADAGRLSDTVSSANDVLRRATGEAERRVGEFNALIGVVQEEAENLFIGSASAVRGLRAGTDRWRRDRDDGGDAPSGRLGAGDDEDEYGDDDRGTEIRVTRRGRRRSWLDD